MNGPAKSVGHTAAEQKIFDYLNKMVVAIGRVAVAQVCEQFLKQGNRVGTVPTKRKPIPQAWILAACKRQGFVCSRCGMPFGAGDVTGDHTVPLAEGGKHSASNITAMHRVCNSKKGSLGLMAESKRSGRTIKEIIEGQSKG